VIASTVAFIKYSYKRRDACGVDISTRGGTERELTDAVFVQRDSEMTNAAAGRQIFEFDRF